MAGTGSELNLVKSNVIKSKEIIDGEETIKNNEITNSHVYINDSIIVNISGRFIPFHIVHLIFPIEQNEILDSEFLKRVSASIN